MCRIEHFDQKDERQRYEKKKDSSADENHEVDSWRLPCQPSRYLTPFSFDPEHKMASNGNN